MSRTPAPIGLTRPQAALALRLAEEESANEALYHWPMNRAFARRAGRLAEALRAQGVAPTHRYRFPAKGGVR